MLNRIPLALTLALALLATACVPAPVEDEAISADAEHDSFRQGNAPIEEQSREAFGVLNLVNAGSLALLDDDVRLDARAAANIVAHRQGKDGQDGTADDDAFDDLAELDAISYVGPSALEKLLVFATANGYLPAEEPTETTPEGELLEGSDEALLILDLVNSADVELLDTSVGLDVRAARNIVSYRKGADQRDGTADDNTFETIREVDQISYVGDKAIGLLRAYVASYGADPIPAPESVTVHDVTEPSVESMGVLRLANHADEEELDALVGLDRRAVAGILAARPFASLAALDDAAYVGASAFELLRGYAVLTGKTGPIPADQIGVIQEVAGLCNETQHSQSRGYCTGVYACCTTFAQGRRNQDWRFTVAVRIEGDHYVIDHAPDMEGGEYALSATDEYAEGDPRRRTERYYSISANDQELTFARRYTEGGIRSCYGDEMLRNCEARLSFTE